MENVSLIALKSVILFCSSMVITSFPHIHSLICRRKGIKTVFAFQHTTIDDVWLFRSCCKLFHWRSWSVAFPKHVVHIFVRPKWNTLYVEYDKLGFYFILLHVRDGNAFMVPPPFHADWLVVV